MQSHFNKDDDDDEKEDDSSIYQSTINITTDPAVTDGSVVMRWDSDVGEFAGVHWDDETADLRREFKQHKDEMNARAAEMEDQILLVRRDVLLEEDFEELKEAWNTYNELLKKLRTFKALQDSA